MAEDHNPPFAMSLDTDLLDRLGEIVRTGKARSVSALIRDALEPFDFDEYEVIRPTQKLISVRMPVEVRDSLKQAAETKQTSIGHLVRTAIESYLINLDHESPDQLKMTLTQEPPPVVAPVPAKPVRAAKEKPKAKAAKSKKSPSKAKPAQSAKRAKR